MSERRLPPVTGVGMTSLALIVAGGIYLAAHLPDRVPLGPAIALLCASALLLAGNLVALALVPGFAWGKFFEVAKWALLAYAITAGLIARDRPTSLRTRVCNAAIGSSPARRAA